MQDAADNLLEPEGELARQIAVAAPGRAGLAEAEFCRRMGPRIRLYGLRHLRDVHAAADLVQQVLLMTLQKLRTGEMREPERVVSFVFGACRLTVLEMRRGASRREQLLAQFAEDFPVADAAPAPHLDHDRLADCLGGLPERERTVLVMTFYDDQPAERVAAALGTTAGNVRVIRHRALSRLRSCVQDGKGPS